MSFLFKIFMLIDHKLGKKISYSYYRKSELIKNE